MTVPISGLTAKVWIWKMRVGYVLRTVPPVGAHVWVEGTWVDGCLWDVARPGGVDLSDRLGIIGLT